MSSKLPVADLHMLDLSLAVLAGVLMLVWGAQWILQVIAILYGRVKLHRGTSSSDVKCRECEDGAINGVSIIKPLKGIDNNLFVNLDSFFRLSYPKYELLFCLESEDDPALHIVRTLAARYPSVDSRLFIGASNVGINPKVQNMLNAYRASKYQLVLISDSSITIESDTLWCMMDCLKDNVGLVHQLPYKTYSTNNLSSILETVYFGTYHARIYLCASLCGINCVTGMSTLFRRDVLDEAGGLESLSTYLAEDFYLGQLFLDRGWRLAVCSETALQNPGKSSVTAFHARMIRWHKLRLSLVPFTTLFLEPLSDCMLVGLVGAWAAFWLFGYNLLQFFLIHVLLWCFLDYLLLVTVQGGTVPFGVMRYVVTWLVREGLSFPLQVKAHMTPYLTWRSRKYVVHSGGVGEIVLSPSHFWL